MFNFPPHRKSVCALPGENRTNKILLFLLNAVLLLNLNNAQKHILLTFLTLWLTFYSIISFFNCLQQNCLKYGRIVRTQAWRCFLHSLTSIVFCFRLIQTSPVTSWIRKHSWTSSGRHCDMTVKPCNWLAAGGQRSGQIEFTEVFLFTLTHDLLGRFPQLVQEQKLCEVGT